MPLMGGPRDFENPALVGVRLGRVRGFNSYLIVYRPMDNGIEVIRVLHAARDIDAILKGDQ